MKSVRPETLAAQALHAIDPATGAIAPPIVLSTTFARDESYQPLGGMVYARDESPAPKAAEGVLAALEGGAAALIFSSGMAAATTAIRALLRPGDHVVAPRACYFGVRSWLSAFCARWGVALDLVDMADTDAVRGAVRAGQTKLVWAETPANPTWELTDLAAVADIAHAAGARLGVDSTVGTPVHTRPLALGADLVMHSATKYLAGHSDVLAGALVTAKADEWWTEIARLRHDEGAVLGPVEAFLLLRGMRTLFVRVERQSRTAHALAERLATLPGVTVRYPGLPSHPQHALAQRQMTGGFGGMLSIHTGGGAERALAVANRTRVWVRATSLGGVESLIEHRFTAEGAATVAPPDLLRLSVGLEHVDDLFEDLRAALESP